MRSVSPPVVRASAEGRGLRCPSFASGFKVQAKFRHPGQWLCPFRFPSSQKATGMTAVKKTRGWLAAAFIAGIVAAACDRHPPQAAAEPADDPPAERAPVVVDAPATLEEARGRARLLHETLHGVLQVMHRDFFREDEGLRLPSRSLEDVFAGVAETRGVTFRWLAVNAQAMNIDHEPRDDFERKAVKALADGKTEFDAREGDAFRYAGAVRLASQCLKCHVPARMSTKDRTAALMISMPMRTK